jgi:hypothetical protein
MARREHHDPHHDAYDADEALWDRHGHRWRRQRGIIEPAEADEIVRAGGVWAVEWCGGGRDWHLGTDRTPWKEVQRKLVDPRKLDRLSAKARRKGRSRTVMFAEEWSGEGGDRLVLVVEGSPHLR